MTTSDSGTRAGAVAAAEGQVDDGATASLSSTTTMAATTTLRDLMDQVNPRVLNAALSAALETASDSKTSHSEAQKAAVLAGVASRALESAQESEKSVDTLLLDILNARMEKVENRLGLIDDVEKMVEVERVALELERRDLFIRRGRYWLGDE